MVLLKTVSTSFRKFFSIFTIFTEEIPREKKDGAENLHELTAFGRQLFWEKRRQKALLREQQNHSKQ